MRMPNFLCRGLRKRVTALSLLFVLLLRYPCAAKQSDRLAEQDTGRAAAASQTPKSGIENWVALPVEESDLRAELPVLVEKDEYPEFTRDFMRVQWRAGDPIDLYVILPKGVAKPPVILYLSSYPSDTNRFLDPDFCRYLVKDQVAAVGFVSALTGHRYHDRPMKEWFVSELQEVLGTSVHDVQMVLNYLSTRGDVDLNRTGMFGKGSGATIAILSAAVDRRIKVLDVFGPWGAWPEWLSKSALVPEGERTSYLKSDFVKGVAALDPVEWLPRVTSEKVRLQNLRSDTVSPVSAQQRVEFAASRRTEIVVFNDDEALRKAYDAAGLFDWINQQVRQINAVGDSAARVGSHAGGSLPSSVNDVR